MSGSVHKRVSPRTGKTSWQARCRVRAGEGWRWHCASFPTQREAKAAVLRWQTTGTEEPTTPDAATLRAYLAYWLEHVKGGNLRASTRRSYREQIAAYILPALGDTPINALTTTQIQLWESALRTRISTRGRPFSARMVRYSHSILAGALRHAHLSGLIPTNPMIGVVQPRRESPKLTTWAEGETARFLAAAETATYAPLYLVALATGLRIGELLALRWSDLALERGILHVRQALARTGRHGDTDVPKNPTSARAISLGPRTVAALRSHRAVIVARQLAKGAAWQDSDLVFPSAVGTMIEPTNVRREWVRLQDAAGVPRLRFHDLRHLNATTAILHGVPINTVSERLGHADIRTTLGQYVRSTPGAEVAAALTIEALILPDNRSSAG